MTSNPAEAATRENGATTVRDIINAAVARWWENDAALANNRKSQYTDLGPLPDYVATRVERWLSTHQQQGCDVNGVEKCMGEVAAFLKAGAEQECPICGCRIRHLNGSPRCDCGVTWSTRAALTAALAVRGK